MTTTTAATRCTSPISWLRLERYHLGELSSNERASIAEHLSSCDACTTLLTRIEREDEEDLPPLPIAPPMPDATAAAARPPPPIPITRAVRWYARPRTMAIAGALALAAFVLIAIGRRPSIPGEEDPLRDPVRVKGSDIAFTLVREDSALLAEAGGPYHDGERFKALVTCPPGAKAKFDVAVFEGPVKVNAGAMASFPLDAPTEIACGNSVPLPGAFRITGHDRVTVCLVWEVEGSVDRDAIRHTPPDLLVHAQCKILDPSP